MSAWDDRKRTLEAEVTAAEQAVKAAEAKRPYEREVGLQINNARYALVGAKERLAAHNREPH